MKKTILFKRPILRSLFLTAFGLITAELAIQKIMGTPGIAGVLIGVFSLLCGVTAIFYWTAQLMYKFAPKVLVDDNGILFKENVFTGSKRLFWEELYCINIKDRTIEMNKSDSYPYDFKVPSDPEDSLKVKLLLIESAKQKGISVMTDREYSVNPILTNTESTHLPRPQLTYTS